MKRRRRHHYKKGFAGIAALVVIASVLSFTGYAFTNTLTVPATTKAGDGNAGIAVQNSVNTVDYVPDTNDPSKLASIVLTFSPALSAGHVYAAIGTTVWTQACVNAAGTWTCTYTAATEPTVVGALNLRVVATD
jgi:hypothetical protein